MASPILTGKFRPINPLTGRHLPGGRVEILSNRSTRPSRAFRDAGLTQPAQSFTLDQNGEAEIWIQGVVRLRVRDVSNRVVDTIDDVVSLDHAFFAEPADLFEIRTGRAATVSQTLTLASVDAGFATNLNGATGAPVFSALGSGALEGNLLVSETLKVRTAGAFSFGWSASQETTLTGQNLYFRVEPRLVLAPGGWTGPDGTEWREKVVEGSGPSFIPFTNTGHIRVNANLLNFNVSVPVINATDQPDAVTDTNTPRWYPNGMPFELQMSWGVYRIGGRTTPPQRITTTNITARRLAGLAAYLEQLNPQVAFPNATDEALRTIDALTEQARGVLTRLRQEDRNSIFSLVETPTGFGNAAAGEYLGVRVVGGEKSFGFLGASDILALVGDASADDKGFMTPAQFTKLDGIEDSATADMTGAEIVAAIDAALGSTTWKTGGSPGSGGGGLTAVATGDSISGTGTVADPLNVADTFLASSTSPGLMSSAEHVKLMGIEDSATADQTAEEIRTLLDGLIGSTNWRTGVVDAHQLGTTLATATAGDFPSGGKVILGSTSPFVPLQAVNLARLAAALSDELNLEEDEDTWAQQFSVLGVFNSAQNAAFNIPNGAQNLGTPFTFRVPFDGTVRSDEANVGLTHSSGRISFTNISSSVRTTLRLTGKVPYFYHDIVGVVVRVLLREYDSLNQVQQDQLLYQTGAHAHSGSGGQNDIDLPLGDVPVTVAAHRTYEVVVETTPQIQLEATSSHGIRANADTADLVAFRRWTADDTGNEFTDADEAKLDGIQAGAQVNVKPNWDADESAAEGILNRPAILAPSFPPVDDLDTPPSTDGQRAFLTRLSGGRPEGFYVEEDSGVTPNIVRFTVAVDPLNSDIHGALNNPANTFGSVDIRDDHWLGGVTFAVSPAPFVNIHIPNSLALDDGTQSFYVRITAPDGNSADFTINEGTPTGNFTRGGVTFRTFPAMLGVGGLTNTQTTLLESLIASEGSDEQASMLVYTDTARTMGLGIHNTRDWGSLYDQQHLKPNIEEDEAAKRLINLAKVGRDFPYLGVFDSLSAASAVITNDNAGKEFDVQDRSSRSTDIARYLIRAGYPGTGGTVGAAKHRNRIKFRLVEMGNHQGYYWTANILDNILTFDNVHTRANIDNNGLWVWASFYDGPGNPYVEVGLSSDIGNRETFTLVVHGVLNASGAASSETLDFTRVAGGSGSFGGRTGHTFRATLTTEAASRLHNREWEFSNNEVTIDLINSATVTTPIPFNPDTIEFTSGSGYVAPSGVIAPEAVLVRGLGPDLLGGDPIPAWRNTVQNLSGWTDLGFRLVTGRKYYIRATCTAGGPTQYRVNEVFVARDLNTFAFSRYMLMLATPSSGNTVAARNDNTNQWQIFEMREAG